MVDDNKPDDFWPWKWLEIDEEEWTRDQEWRRLQPPPHYLWLGIGAFMAIVLLLW